jgi:hypothetical protein
MEHGVFVHALFRREHDAVAAVENLIASRFASSDISALMQRDDKVEELQMAHRTGMGAGAALGGVLGAVGGAVMLGGGGVFVAGPLLLALEGAIAGGALGTLAGTLGGLGFWQEEIDFPDEAFRDGAVLIGVSTAEGRVADAERALKEAGAEEVYRSTKDDALRSAEHGSLRSASAHPRS